MKPLPGVDYTAESKIYCFLKLRGVDYTGESWLPSVVYTGESTNEIFQKLRGVVYTAEFFVKLSSSANALKGTIPQNENYGCQLLSNGDRFLS